MKKIFTTVLLSVFTLAIFAQTDIIPPQLNSPDSGAVKRMPDVLLDWYASAGMGEITYTLELDQDMNFSNPDEFVTIVTSAEMSELKFGETYYWRVKAEDETNEESMWSDVFSFTVVNRFSISKPDDGEPDMPPNAEIKWKTNDYGSGNPLSGITHIDCQIDTEYFWSNTASEVTTKDLYDVAALDNVAWAVGKSGIILFYDGNEWTEQESSTNKDLYAVYFIDENNGWAVGKSGTIVYFDGTDWIEQESDASSDLFGVDFIDASNGWAVGEEGAITYFDGTEWAEQSIEGYEYDLFGIGMISDSDGWAVGDGDNDGGYMIAYNGTEWEAESSPSTKDLLAITFLDANNGWAVGKSGSIIYNDGTAWTDLDPDIGVDLLFVTALSTTDVWAGGEEGRLAQFDGTEWLEVASGAYEMDLNGIGLYSNEFGYIVGEDGTIISKNLDAFTSDENILSTHSDSTSLILSELFFGKDYFFRIRGRHAADTSEWSSVNYFSTIAHPENVSPEDGDTDQMLDVVVYWEEIPGTYEYIYELCTDPEFSYSCTGYSDTASFVPQGIVFGETYYWHIKARHNSDTTDWSDTWSFQVIDQMTHVSPGNGAIVLDIFPTLVWEAVSGVNGYYIAYADNEDFVDAEITRVNDIEETSLIIPEQLTPAIPYFWRCRAFIAGDTTAWSSPWSFTLSGIGINEVLTENNIDIFPNPSNGVLNVELDIAEKTNIQLTISNLLGEALFEENYSAQGLTTRSFNLNGYGKGIYLLQLQSGEEIFTKRVVLK